MAEMKLQRGVLGQMEVVASELDMLVAAAGEHPTLQIDMLEATLERLRGRLAVLFCDQLGLDYHDNRLRDNFWSAMLGSIDVEELLAEHGIEVVAPGELDGD